MDSATATVATTAPFLEDESGGSGHWISQSPPTYARDPAQPPIDSAHLSPHQLPRSNSGSPRYSGNPNTPADSVSTFSHYQSSDYSGDDDPFFGVDFDNDGGTPSFLEEMGLTQGSRPSRSNSTPGHVPPTITTAGAGVSKNPVTARQPRHPLTPEQGTPPRNGRNGISSSPPNSLPKSVSPHDLQRPFNAPQPSRQVPPQLTPSGSCESSDDGLAPAAPHAMPALSPLVTVSDWGRDNGSSSQPVERAFLPDGRERANSVRSTPGDLISSTPSDATFPRRDSRGKWLQDPSTGQRGLGPDHRSRTAIDSINDVVSRRELEERKQVVDTWLDGNVNEGTAPEPPPKDVVDVHNPRDSTEDDGIPLGNDTENKYVPGQTYFHGTGGEFTEQDTEIIQSNRNWADAPVMHPITKDGAPRYQPETSQLAMAKFERMCQDNESIVSVAATWGTRRRSVQGIVDVDIEALSGNILKRLTISRGDPRKPSGSLLSGFRTLVRKPSASLKRSRTANDEAGFMAGQEDSTPHLAPPPRTSSWGKKPTPSINTALVSMGQSVAAVGAGKASHRSSGSISATSITSPKSPFAGLTVKNTIRRPRSKSDLPSTGAHSANAGFDPSHPNLVGLWKRNGGPPVGALGTSTSFPPVSAGPVSAGHMGELDDDDDDDDEFEDSEMKTEPSNLIDSVTTNIEGFKSHIMRLNPTLPAYLADRIAHQQTIRYKSLLNLKVKHIQQGARCACGPLCITLGGSARVFDQKGEPRTADYLSSPDSELTPIEGVITQESFPSDIPLPPTATLPAELECQICYQPKKFQKPSDWTKHVHEDVQPFTCTWEKCKEPKIFKRKADWVRHENEGHRHLEWWRCDVDDCSHTCYRRDNFLQHLVREHKFSEPKVKTKAALKRAGVNDPTWQKVERCHFETSKRAQEEPCKFCGKQFPTWKKLTVHLAKHMEQISLPVLRLVMAEDVAADTVISPVHDPPRPFPALPIRQDGSGPPLGYAPTSSFGDRGGQHPAMAGGRTPVYQDPHGVFEFGAAGAMSSSSFHDPFYGSQFSGAMAGGLDAPVAMSGLVSPAGSTVYNHSPQSHTSYHQPVPGIQRVQSMPVESNSYHLGAGADGYMTVPTPVEAFPTLNAGLGLSAGPHQYTTLQTGYDGLMDGDANVYVSRVSTSPYSTSPNQNVGGFYKHQ